ncbi:MAG TPA: hypothetical protein VE093_40255 [Polyangiaceae bacterium]|nr:hypothetical protein [Polyangiaceae bacterium]
MKCPALGWYPRAGLDIGGRRSRQRLLLPDAYTHVVDEGHQGLDLVGVAHDSWSLVHDSWSLVLDPWSLVHEPWRLVLDPWRLVHDPWRLVLDPWRLVHYP